MARTKIAEFEAGRPVEGVFAVLRKTRRRNRNGDPYLVLELSDSTGRIEAKVWQNADFFDRNVREGDQVSVVGRPTMFREELQLDVRRMDRVDAPFEESFVPAATRELDELAGELDFLVGELTHPGLSALTRAVWDGPDRDRLLKSPATQADHHAYLGGLVEHTISVASICMTAAERHERLDRELLLAAALLHDIGRAKEIEVGDQIAIAEEGALYGHVLLGHELLLGAAGRAGIDVHSEPWWPALVHAVSTHHGPAEKCRTREALTLASANALDVRLASR
jgi:3'-5' exoribonuclease